MLKSEGCKFAPNAFEGGKAHNFQILRENYNKRLDVRDQKDGVVNDRSASYSMLFCTQCGESREIKVH
jgi:hypothetical protein